MSEQELKLHAPAASDAALRQELHKHGAARIRLHALYFDTPARELARARVALRLRLEGDAWMQTLKTPGGDAITRRELNHPRPGPVLDLSVYAGTDIEGILAGLRGQLGLRYETDVQRLLCKVRGRHGTVEIAYDTGILRAGPLELPISEVEFELLSGRPAAIFAVARDWQTRHGLILDARSKSERGDALATLAHRLADAPQDDAARHEKLVADFWAPRGAAAVALAEDMDPPRAMAAIAAECLEHIVRNAAPLAEVDTLGVYRAGKAEHVHQLRVGMRRLRSAWKLFDGWIAPPPGRLVEGMRSHFAAFGASRDQDVLEETIIPMLMRAGMPVIPPAPRPGGQDDAQAIATSPAFQAWLTDLLEWSLDVQPCPRKTAAPPPETSGESAHAGPIDPVIIPLPEHGSPVPLRKLLAARLHRWHEKVVEQGRRYTELDIEARHDLRKRAKRLRYGLAFAEPLLPAARLQSYRKQLARVQDILGEFNDLAVAREYYQTRLADHPQAWFALGWISARLDALSEQAQAAFDDLAKSKPFWK